MRQEAGNPGEGGARYSKAKGLRLAT